ncbi:unnamed protein product (macronuclear) [Paramecium tetraurelia]|uniref:Uncharacterized protein n=1 Tax=Paramecium tetraurelia TaxID=5888 RepID=A0BII7_PARTE|nr:uncharacterized protein GSPATT00004726001 [Paramecium tetraurelia]CAK58354.1 unnamed protein product [Paramecium tetraurelia]|eukprot:XP_001425752.1 hypothetical protein (macronuclear) [Paramecium tetraurelia strain d4-2]
MGLIRIRGIPKKGEYQEYFAKSLTIEFATNIFYMIALFAIDNVVFQLPIALHFLVGAAELWTQLSQDEGFTLRFAYYIVKNRVEILITKQKIEIYLFFYSVIGVFLRKTSLFLGVFIFQNILLKTKCNQKMMIAQSNIKDWYRSNLLENSKVPQPLQKLFGIIWIGYEKLITIF